MPQAVAPVPTMASRKAIEQFAEDVSRKLNPVPRYGLETLLYDLGRGPDLSREGDPPTLMRIRRDREFSIYRSFFATRPRLTYEAACCLGHLFLHWPMTKKAHPGAAMDALVYAPDGDDAQRRVAWEANWFASSFLMPRDEFAEVWRQGVAPTREHFGLLERHVRMRASALGMPAWGLEAAEEMPV